MVNTFGPFRKNVGHSVGENGDIMITYEQRGLSIIKDGAVLRWIGVGGLRGHKVDEDLAK